MNLTGIISIAGKPGLFKVVAQGKNNVIVESLEDKKRFPAYSSDRISALDDISIYTTDEDVSLKIILRTIYDKENGAATISHKEDKKNLENYILEILPNYDQERVYISDVKKIFQWYNLLHKSGELKLSETDVDTENSETEESKSEEKAPKKEKKVVSGTPKTKPTTTKATPKTTASKKVATVKTSTSRGK